MLVFRDGSSLQQGFDFTISFAAVSRVQRISRRYLRGRRARHPSRGQVKRRRIDTTLRTTRHTQRHSTRRRKRSGSHLKAIIQLRLTRHVRTHTSRTYHNQRRGTTSREKEGRQRCHSNLQGRAGGRGRRTNSSRQRANANLTLVHSLGRHSVLQVHNDNRATSRQEGHKANDLTNRAVAGLAVLGLSTLSLANHLVRTGHLRGHGRVYSRRQRGRHHVGIGATVQRGLEGAGPELQHSAKGVDRTGCRQGHDTNGRDGRVKGHPNRALTRLKGHRRRRTDRSERNRHLQVNGAVVTKDTAGGLTRHRAQRQGTGRGGGRTQRRQHRRGARLLGRANRARRRRGRQASGGQHADNDRQADDTHDSRRHVRHNKQALRGQRARRPHNLGRYSRAERGRGNVRRV